MRIEETLAEELTGARRQKPKCTRRLVQEALLNRRRSRLEQELKDGYQAMAKEDRATAEWHLAIGWEVVK